MRKIKDTIGANLMFGFTIFSGLLIFFILAAIIYKSYPIISQKHLGGLLFSQTWQPLKGQFGFYPFIAGTFWITVLTMFISVPVSILSAIYLSEYSSEKIRETVKPLVDLLAGIPSVVYGIWGVLIVVPFLREKIIPFLESICGNFSFFRINNYTGYSIFAASIVLAIMVFPILISVSIEVLRGVPFDFREISFSLGATKWQTIKHTVMRRALPGIIAAVILGFSRAFGETMAVLMVAGNVPKTPHSIFDPAYSLSALIANNYGEMLTIPLYDSAIFCAALVLLIVVLLFNIAARIILIKFARRAG